MPKENAIQRVAQRIGGAFRQLRANRPTKAATIFMWPSWRNDTPLWQIIDYSGYVNEGFNLNTLIYAAVMYKVRAMTAAPMRAWTGEVDTPELLPPDNELQGLVARPNPQQSWVEFHGQNIVYLNISGNSYVWYDPGTDKERQAAGVADTTVPLAMYSLRPDRMFIVPGKVRDKVSGKMVSTVLGYVYVPEGASAFGRMGPAARRQALHDGRAVPIQPEQVMHVKLPNPLDPLEGMGYGLSPLSAGARNTDVDNSVTHFLQLFFKQGVMLPGVLSTDVRLDDKTLARVKNQWKEMYGGYERWAEEIGVLEAGTEYQRVGLTFEEMGFETLDERNESRILMPFGVPPILVGSVLGLNRATYSNYIQARRAFWEDTMVPESRLFETDFQYYLNVSDEEWFVKFDMSRVPAFEETRQQEQDRFAKAWETGAITRNEYRRRLNLSEVEDGMVYRTQPTTIFLPTGEEPAPVSDTVTGSGETEVEEDDRKVLPFRVKKKAL